MVDGDPTQVVAADLPPIDGLALCAAHEGRAHLLLRWIDPSLVDEHDGLSIDPALDLYDPANWADGAAAPPRFEPAFLARFLEVQRARRDRIEACVRTRLAALRAPARPLSTHPTVGKGYVPPTPPEEPVFEGFTASAARAIAPSETSEAWA